MRQSHGGGEKLFVDYAGDGTGGHQQIRRRVLTCANIRCRIRPPQQRAAVDLARREAARGRLQRMGLGASAVRRGFRQCPRRGFAGAIACGDRNRAETVRGVFKRTELAQRNATAAIVRAGDFIGSAIGRGMRDLRRPAQCGQARRARRGHRGLRWRDRRAGPRRPQGGRHRRFSACGRRARLPRGASDAFRVRRISRQCGAAGRDLAI